jgi:hypothetical protein
MFPTIGFLACQILKIFSSQIETNIILSLIGILINLKIWFLQLIFKKLRQIDFCYQKLFE